MAEARFKLISTLLFGLVCLIDGRVLSSFNSEQISESASKSNELIDQLSGNLRQNFGPRGADKYIKQGRLSEAEFSAYNLQEPNGPGTYAFGYDNVVDPMGNEQYRSEEKMQNGTVVGEYGYTDYKSKKIIRVTYTADRRGYSYIIGCEYFFLIFVQSRL